MTTVGLLIFLFGCFVFGFIFGFIISGIMRDGAFSDLSSEYESLREKYDRLVKHAKEKYNVGKEDE